MLSKIDFYQNTNFSINSTLHLVCNLKYCCFKTVVNLFSELQASGGKEIMSLLLMFSPNFGRRVSLCLEEFPSAVYLPCQFFEDLYNVN